MFNPTLLIAAAAVAAAAVQPAQAQSAQPAQQAPKAVSKADFTKNLDTRFGALDANRDGSVTKEEVAAAQAKAVQQAQAARQQQVAAEFKKLDTNNDSQLSLAEFRAAIGDVRPGQTPDKAVAQFDANKDGRVTVQEYRAPQLASFDRADANKDGVLTPQEVQARQR